MTMNTINSNHRIALPRYSRCFVCGKSNPIGLNIEFFYENEKIVTSFSPKPEHIGYKNTVHGGIIATLLDEAMGWTSIISQPALSVAADLSVRYKLPARLGQKFIISAEIEKDRRKIIQTTGRIELEDGTLLCAGTGKYMPLSPDEMEDLIEYSQWQDSFIPCYEKIQALRSNNSALSG